MRYVHWYLENRHMVWRLNYVNKHLVSCDAQLAHSEGMFGVRVFCEGKRSGKISGRVIFCGVSAGQWSPGGHCRVGRIFQVNYMQDYKSPCVAVMICATLVNTQTDTHTETVH